MKTLEKNLLNLKAIIMAGGKGSRLKNPSKPFIEVCGKPMILWVYETARKIVSENNIYVATLKDHLVLPLLKSIVSEERIIFTSGKGYEYDVVEAIIKVGTPAILLPADTPFIYLDDLFNLVSLCKTAICNLTSNGNYVGISFWRSLDFNSYSNIESTHYIINVNTNEELKVVKEICKEGLS